MPRGAEDHPHAQSLRRPERSEGRRKDWADGDDLAELMLLKSTQQLSHRHAPSFIRHVLASFRQHSVTAAEAAKQLGLSPSRFYTLSTDYLRACARKKEGLWIPGTSGGDHATAWPDPVTDLLKKAPGLLPHLALTASPPRKPCACSPSNSTAPRSVAGRYKMVMPIRLRPNARPPQCVAGSAPRSANSGNWTLHPIAGSPCSLDFPMLNMLDDCSRVFVGSKLYGRELLLSYLDFLPAAFLIYGRPLQIYVDYHAIFFHAKSRRGDSTRLGAQVLRHQFPLCPNAPSQRQSRTRAPILAGPAPTLFCQRTNHRGRNRQPHTSTLCDSSVTSTRPIANCA